MDLLRTILLYLSMLFVSSVQIAPDPATVNVTPSPAPTPYGVVATATPVATPTPTPVPTPNITPNSAYGQLVMGDRGELVKQLQQRLTELLYYTGEIDGAYGNQTRHAVELFQYQNGLRVDGIAGKYTQTILYESAEVQSAPPALVPTNTPVFHLDETVTPPPATQAPVVTSSPTPSPEPSAQPAQAEASPDPSLPVLLDRFSFVLDGFSQPLTVQDTDTLLHPVESAEILYVPLMEILKNAGNVVIENTDGTLREYAYSVLTDFYQVSYTAGEDARGSLVWEKNAKPQPMLTRSAVLLDGIFYLPLEEVQRITGIGFMTDDAAGTITVTMPTPG